MPLNICFLYNCVYNTLVCILQNLLLLFSQFFLYDNHFQCASCLRKRNAVVKYVLFFSYNANSLSLKWFGKRNIFCYPSLSVSIWIPNFCTQKKMFADITLFYYFKALSAMVWKQSGENTLLAPRARLFTNLISSQRYGITPLDPWKRTLHWSEKLATSHYAQTPNALAFSVPAKQSSSSPLSICN